MIPIRFPGLFLAALLFPVCAFAAEGDSRALYVELLGKGGLWGLGYDTEIGERFSVGATGSVYGLDGQRVISLSPYLGAYPVIHGKNRWLVQAGPQWVHESVLSPVPEWQGMSSGRLGAEVSTGYEYRDRWLFRAYALLSIGNGGAVPWLGMSVGWAF